MREVGKIVVFTQSEELGENEKNFEGILVSQIPGPGEARGLVSQVSLSKSKPIGIINLPEEKMDLITGKVITLLLEKKMLTLEDDFIPEIAIDTNLGYWYLENL